MTPITADVVVIGAGFAGAATAYHLARRGVKRVVVLEQENLPGRYASGLNAAMGRQIVTSHALLPLAVEGMRFLREPPADLPAREYLRRCGSLILAEGREAAALQAFLAEFRRHGLTVAWLDAPAVQQRVAVAAGGSFEGGLFCAEDGIVDIAGLLDGYLKAAQAGGTLVLTSQRVLGVTAAAGRVTAVQTEGGAIETPRVVNAAGPWAADIGRLAGALPVPLRPCRRHVVVTGALDWVDGSWPFTWDVSHHVYFRPEPPGLLLSPCDETDHPAGPAAVDPAMLEWLAEKVAHFMPGLGNLTVQRSWAGLRTLTPDGNFVIGRDPLVEGFVWCAGLGGHGVTTSAAVGRLAAEAVLGGAETPAHSPDRFTR